MTDTADLVKELRHYARLYQGPKSVDLIAQAADALSAKEAELAEAKRLSDGRAEARDVLGNELIETRNKLDAAESALTHARERIAELEGQKRDRDMIEMKYGGHSLEKFIKGNS